MSKVTKTFKSGNSVAVRLPAALGVKAGTSVRVREEAGRYLIEPVAAPKRKFDVEKVWGIGQHLNLQPLADEDRVFEHRELLWDDPERQSNVQNRGT